ncbi:MAG: histidine kinase [Candidatus Muproteobacteria bacterium RIFCSPHIGHO2_01_FULL_65_16]|uniref:Histidine kinase n=2 Tax=Candidatus Muproteobacteria TaxID=1817795 RepID=A0A1F6TLD9_9PROT|nr:MAG: histidine kinase [Candidatus Muproteobacteria bacterium RIFCSPHIGHO2_01_FULL_65_16]OGI53090.1 MAG: histidine kinase [Candidatus Muproteobacteria bacterium RIFCSPHIGHO2_02_FULL_65_16]
MTVGEICNRDVVVVRRDEPVTEAARRMREHHVGDLVVVDEKPGGRVPVGILTDRDLVIEVIAKGVDLNAVTVGDVMSNQLLTAAEADDVADTIKIMRAKGVRRVPVVSRNKTLAGILAVDDLLDLYSEQIADLTALIAREQKREREKRK